MPLGLPKADDRPLFRGYASRNYCPDSLEALKQALDMFMMELMPNMVSGDLIVEVDEGADGWDVTFRRP
jgi:hypothetical protein